MKKIESYSQFQGRIQLLGTMIGVATALAGCATEAHRSGLESDTPVPSKVAPVGALQPNLDSTKTPEANAEYHFSLAQAYVTEGNPDRAIEEYKLTLMYDPHSALVYARLAGEYIKKGMPSAAMEACKEALQRDPNFTDARLILAGLYSSTRANAAALHEYDVILKREPKHEEAVIYKSQVLVEDGRPRDAAKALKSFLKRSPDSALVQYYLGRAEQGLGNFKDAAVAYRQALILRPSFGQAALSLGFLYEEQKMNDKAVETYKDLYDSTQDLSAANRLATIYLKQEKYVLATPYLESIQAADSEDMNVRVKLGLIRMETKEYDKAIALFKQILEKSPDSDRVLYYLGSVYEEMGQIDQSIAYLGKISPKSKLFSDSALHVAYLLKQTQKVADAKKHIRNAIEQSPEVASFYIFQASLEEDDKNYAKATDILNVAAKKFPQDEKVLYYLGSLYDRQGNTDKGVELMEAILKVNPDNVDALNYIGYTWTSQGVHLNDAEKVLKHALALKPDNGYIQDSWGWYLFVRGRVSEAVPQLEKAVSLKPGESTILEHLGDAYLRANLEEKAFARYSDAARFAETEEARSKLETKVNDLKRVLVQKGKPLPTEYAKDTAKGQDRVPAKNTREASQTDSE